MEYTAKQIFNAGNAAISKCPRGRPYHIDSSIQFSGNGTFRSMIGRNDTKGMLESFGNCGTLFETGYHKYLPKDLRIQMARASLEGIIDSFD